MQVSWAKGSKKVHLGPQDVQVPPVPVPESCGQPASLWLRFTGDPKEWPGKRGRHCKQPSTGYTHRQAC